MLWAPLGFHSSSSRDGAGVWGSHSSSAKASPGDPFALASVPPHLPPLRLAVLRHPKSFWGQGWEGTTPQAAPAWDILSWAGLRISTEGTGGCMALQNHPNMANN